MSGGSLDYAQFKIDDIARSLTAEAYRNGNPPEWRAFINLLQLVGTALHDIEWATSGDTEIGSEIPAIKAALGPKAEELILAELIEDAKKAKLALETAIKNAETIRGEH